MNISLDDLKDYFSFAEAARYLSQKSGNDVSEAEMVRFALDGKLKTNLRIASDMWASSRVVKRLDDVECEVENIGGFDYQFPVDLKTNYLPDTQTAQELGLQKNECLQLDDEGYHFLPNGIWPLPVADNARRHLENYYQSLVGGESVMEPLYYGVWVRDYVGGYRELHRREQTGRIKKDGNPEVFYTPYLEIPSGVAAGVVILKADIQSLLSALVTHDVNETSSAESLQIQTNKKTPQIRDKGIRQINAIVADLKRLNYNPLSLPAPAGGQRGVKAEVADSLSGTDLFKASKAFENAWQNATKSGDIKFQKTSEIQ